MCLALAAGAAGAAGGISAGQIAMMALSAVGTLMSARAQSQEGAFQAAMSQRNAQIAQNNAIAQDQLAKDAILRGERAEQAHRLRVAKLKGEQRAAFGAAGVELGSGSPLEAVADTAQFGELDALTIRSNAEREARAFRVGAMNFRSDAQLQTAQARLDRQRGRNAAFGTLLGGAGRVADQWYRFSRK